MWPFRRSRFNLVVQSTKKEIVQAEKQIDMTKRVMQEVESRSAGSKPQVDLARIIAEGIMVNVRS